MRSSPGAGLVVLASSLLLLAACDGGSDVAVTMPDTTPSEITVPATTASVVTVPATTVPATTDPPAPTGAPVTTAAPATTTTPSAGPPTIEELIATGEVLNIAHAGGDQAWPHSTFYAFDRAVEAGADVLEMDVQLTGDGVLIVQHDDTVDGTTDGTGRVDSFTFDEITQLDAAYWYSPGCWPCRDQADDAYVLRGVRTGAVPAPDGVDPDTLRIVSFAELVERYPDMPLDVEIKGTEAAAAATADALATAIVEYDLTEHVVVVSFDDPTVEYFRSIAPDVAVSPGVGEMSAWLLQGADLPPGTRIVQVPPMFGDVPVITPEFWDSAAAADVDVWVWPNDWRTQENAEFYAELIADGADGVIVGRPDLFPN